MNLKRIITSFILVFALGIQFSCEDDDQLNIIEGLDFVIATLNEDGTETGVLPKTAIPDGRIVYTVDFGNPNDDEDVFQTSGPLVTYQYPLETATYTITVTAALSGKDDVIVTKDHTIVYVPAPDPGPGGGNGGDTPTGIVGTWKLAPESGAFGVGPAQDDVSWFSSSSDDVTTRACLFDDEYVFNADGTFQNVLGADTWLEGWQGAATEGCGTPVFPHDGSNPATYSFDGSSLTLNGLGAFMGLAKVNNDGELSDPSLAVDSITYIAELSENDTRLELDINFGGIGFWKFKFVKQVEESPIVGTWKLAPESGAFAVGPAQDDVSWFSSSSDDVTTRACLFDDEYVFSADGTFQNILGADTWLEAWQGAEEGCGAPVFPHDGSNPATWSFDGSSLTISGTGAYMGLSKVNNDGELANPSGAVDSITYIAELSENNTRLELDINFGGIGFWKFKFVKQ
jgi:hypothetical protein